MNDQKYWAFISYSHKDNKWGDWLHAKLERYKVPKQLIGQPGRTGPIPKRVYPIFRDREELPTSADLSTNIEQALQQSRYLIVICSPNSAQSQWVNEEIKTFKRLGGADRVLCLIVDGEPNASDQAGTKAEECFPDAVRYEVTAEGDITDTRAEPIAADLRPHADGKANAKLKLIAGLLGVNFDDLKQRDKRRQRLQRAALSLGVVFTLVAICTAMFLFEQQALKREFEHASYAPTLAQKITADGRITEGLLLWQYAANTLQNMSLGKFSEWIEQSLDVPISGRAETKRLQALSAHSELTQAYLKHPRIVWTNNTEQVQTYSSGEYAGVATHETTKLTARHEGTTITVSAPDKPEERFKISMRTAEITSLAFSASGQYLLARLSPVGAAVIDLENQSQNHITYMYEATAAAFAPEAHSVLFAEREALNRLDLKTGRKTLSLRLSKKVTKIVASKESTHLIAGHEIGKLYAPENDIVTLKTRGLELGSFAFSANGKWLATADHEQRGSVLRLWDTQSGHQIKELGVGPAYVERLSFADNDRVLAIASRKELQLRSTADGKVFHQIKHEEGHQLHVIESLEAGLLATWSGSRGLSLIALSTGAQQPVLTGAFGPTSAANFSEDGRHLAVGTRNGELLLLSLINGGVDWQTRLPHGHAESIDVSADLNHIAARNNDGYVALWHRGKGAPIELKRHEFEYGSVQFSTDGRMLFTSDYPDFSSTTRILPIYVWDTQTGELIHTLKKQHHGDFPELTYLSRSNQLLVQADGSRIYDLETGKIAATFYDNKLALDKEQQRIVVLNRDGYQIQPISDIDGSLDDNIKKLASYTLSNEDLQLIFPEAPPMLGY